MLSHAIGAAARAVRFGLLATAMLALWPAGAAPASAAADPVLEALIEEALQNHPSIQQAQAELAAAKLRPAQVRTLPDPTFTVGYQNDGWALSIGEQDMTQLQFMWTQPLPYPGKLELGGRISETDAERAAVQLERVRLSLRAQVERAYARLLLARAVDTLIDEQDIVLRQIEGVARARYSVGQGAQQDVLRVQVEITRIEQLRSERQAEIQMRLAELNQLLSRPPEQPLDTSARLGYADGIPELAPFLEGAYERSPELRVAALMRQRYGLQIELARKNLKPDFSLTGGYMNRGGLPPMWQASFGVTWPLYKRTKQEQAIHESVEFERASAALIESLRLQLRYRSQERLARLHSTDRIARLYSDGILPQDRLSVEAALANYESGQIPFLTVLEAINALYSDRAAHLGQLAELRTLRSSLEELSLEADGGAMATGAPAPAPASPRPAMGIMGAGGSGM
jgi:outer membrane protein TolC